LSDIFVVFVVFVGMV